jgi:hypothetical protein
MPKTGEETLANSHMDKAKGEISPGELEPLEPNTLIVENEALRKGFTIIPNYILRDPRVSVGAKIIYTLLLSYAWQEGSCFPGQLRLANDLGLKERMVRYYLTELKTQGFIDIKRRGLGKTNVYVIKDVRTPERQPIAYQQKPDRQYIAGQERQAITDQDGQYIAYNKDTVYKDEEVTKTQQQQRSRNVVASVGTKAQDPDVVVVLVQKGMTKIVARKLAAQYPEEYIRLKIESLDYLQETAPDQVKEPAAWLRRAIEQDWKPPAKFKSKAEREAEALAQAKAEEEERLREEKEREERKQQIHGVLSEKYGVTEDTFMLWEKMEAGLKERLLRGDYWSWVRPSALLTVTDSQVTIGVPYEFTRNEFQDRLDEQIIEVLSAMLGQPVEVEYLVVPELARIHGFADSE